MTTTTRQDHADIRIGTMAGKGDRTVEYLARVAPLGFECFQLNFAGQMPETPLSEIADGVRYVLDEQGEGQTISSLGVFGNPLMDEVVEKFWEQAIDHASVFGTDLICGFTGGVLGESVPDSMPRFAEVFGALTKRAADQGVRIAFENCQTGSTWKSAGKNLAYCPDAWELMFDAVPADNMGLEWEPCHQMCQLIDPMPQLWEWLQKGKIFHIHGKDATIRRDLLEKYGTNGGQKYVWHRTPGFGDSNWTDIISALRQFNYAGTIDIEGWHDPVYRGDLEMTGQVRSLRYLQACRGGTYVANPEGF